MLDQAKPLETGMFAVANDEVIRELDAHNIQCGLNLLGHLDVGL